MRVNLALPPLAEITVCLAMTLVVPASASAQTEPSPAPTEPAVVQESSPASHPGDSSGVPAALYETLHKEQVALFFEENPRLDPQGRASMMRSLKQHFPAGRAVRMKEEADLIIAIGSFDDVPASDASAVSTPDEASAARRRFRVFIYRQADPAERLVLYDSAALARGGVSQRTGLEKRRAALELAMKNLGIAADQKK